MKHARFVCVLIATALAVAAVLTRKLTAGSEQGAVAIEVEATSSVVLPGQKILLTAKVNGKADETVTWHLQEGSAGGSIALSSTYPDAQHTGPQWVYTAPNTGGTYHIVSTARADPEHPVSTALVVQEPVAGCATNSSETGVWKNITPSQVDLTTGDFFGMQAMALDPTDPSTVYVGRAMGGIYKSTDCGASWVKISTGRNAEAMSSGRSWTMVIDPSNPKVIYTNQGYGQSGLFKSTNGGVDWDQILTPNITSVAPYGGFIGAVSIDPDDARHLLVGWHAECPPPHPKVCYAETTDGGDSWKMRDGDASWQGSEGTRFQVLNAKTWIFSSESNGLWRSVDRGASWQRVLGASISHGVGQLYRSKDMEFYFGTANGVMHSADGANWTTLPNSGNLIMGLIGDGKTLYISRAYPSYSPGAAPYRPYFFAAEDPSAEFSAMDSPLMRNGGAELHLDATRHFLYSTNLNAGLWRVKLK